MSYFFWWNKPQHVEAPTVLRCKYSVAKILTDSGIPPDTSYADSLLDFILDSSKIWERRPWFKEYDLERQMETNSRHRARLQRIPDDSVLPARLPLNVLVTLVIPSLIHSTIHLLGWNFVYPSSTEQTLRRISAITLASISFVSIGIVRVLAASGYQGRYNLAWVWVNYQRKRPEKGKCPDFWDIFLGFSVLLLVAARSYIIVEALISLRNLPADTFFTVNWTDFLPHV